MKNGDRDDYLWDRSGEPDPNVQRLESMLERFAHDRRPLELGTEKSARALRGWPWLVGVAAAAAIAIAVLMPRGDDELRIGAPSTTFTAQQEVVVVRLGELAEITLAPGSELRFEHWREDEALFRLARGAIEARVEPPPAVPPNFFLVDTELGRVTDKGCRYELRIESDGTHVVEVTEGAVTFAFASRTVFVPAGAMTRVTARGASTPMFDDASIELSDAVRTFDAATREGDDQFREKGMASVIEACVDARDSLVLWHLLRDDDEAVRERAEAALIDLVGPPEEPLAKGQPSWDPEVWLAFLRIGPWMQAK